LHIPLPTPVKLLENVQLVTVGEEESLYIPPPLSVVVLLENVQLVTVGEELWLNIPPPDVVAELLENVQLVTVGEESTLYIPPPSLLFGSFGGPPILAFPPVMVKPSRTALFAPVTT